MPSVGPVAKCLNLSPRVLVRLSSFGFALQETRRLQTTSNGEAPYRLQLSSGRGGPDEGPATSRLAPCALHSLTEYAAALGARWPCLAPSFHRLKSAKRERQ